MERTLVQFGDVFRHNEKEYVFLAQTDQVLYAALILDGAQTGVVQSMSNRAETASRGTFKKNSPVYSFVILQTSEFRERAAYLAKTDNPEHQALRLEIIGYLNKPDCQSIKKEICSGNSSLPLKLIELVKELNISD